MLALFGLGFGLGLLVVAAALVSPALAVATAGVLIGGVSLLFVDFDRKAKR